MQHGSFQKLLSFLSPYLQVSAHQGNRCSHGMGHITPELILHCVLHYMAGGSHHDICILAGIGKSTIFTCLHRAIDAINKCPNLALYFLAILLILRKQRQSSKAKVVLEYSIDASGHWMGGCAESKYHWEKILPALHTISQDTIIAME